jgi:hypothetical protein
VCGAEAASRDKPKPVDNLAVDTSNGWDKFDKPAPCRRQRLVLRLIRVVLRAAPLEPRYPLRELPLELLI